MLMKRGNRAQFTIFVIVGVIFLSVVILFFFIANKDEILDQPPSQVPRRFMEQCIATAVKPSVSAVFDFGGLVVPKHFIRRNDHAYNYLCFTDVYYDKCYNYYPHLHLIAEEQIRKDSVERVDDCFADLVADYESRGYYVESGELSYNVEIIPGSIRLHVNKPLDTSKDGGNAQSFEDFDLRIPSDMYDILTITRQIVNQEAEFCYFESNGYMVLYPKYNITRFDYLESKLYEVQNRQTKETFKFAVRSCPFAPGISPQGIDTTTLSKIATVESVRERFEFNQ